MGWGGEATGLPHTIGATDVRDGRRREKRMYGRQGWTAGMYGREEGRVRDSGEASTLEYGVGSLETGADSK